MFYKIVSSVLRRNVVNFQPLLRCYGNQNRPHSSKVELDEDAPIKYSTSPASRWKAESSRIGAVESKRLWYEPYVILASITVFLIYFTILREENDIDRELERSLYSRIEGLEEQQLKLSLEYNHQQGKDTKEIKQRLKEIEEEKIKKYYKIN